MNYETSYVCQNCGSKILELVDPERSKREDALEGVPEWGEAFESAMRCSEHDGNAMREVQ